MFENLQQNTQYNLAPRGWGRTSYRLAEIIQLGRIPIYIYDDHEWLPYRNSNISITGNNGYGFSVDGFNSQKVEQLATEIAKNRNTPAHREIMMERVKNVRKYFTYEGVIEQIELFIKDPFGPNGGYLTCSALPPNAKSH